MKKKKKTIYEKYREILERKDLSKEEIDKMRFHVRMMALATMEYLMKTEDKNII